MILDLSCPMMDLLKSILRKLPGGAVMYYTLPANLDVFAINARYEDHRGQSILKVGGYGSDSLILDGFNEASANIPVQGFVS